MTAEPISIKGDSPATSVSRKHVFIFGITIFHSVAMDHFHAGRRDCLAFSTR